MLRIGVVGDSFADREVNPALKGIVADESWMAYIESKGHKIATYGLSGSASWHAFYNFKKFHEQFDHIVFCWSYPHRMQTIPFKYATCSTYKEVEQFYTSGHYKNYDKEEQSEIVQMVLGYQYLCDFNFNMWVQQKMFDEVNDICRRKNIKLVNLLPFVTRTDQEIDFSSRHGDCLFRLFEVSRKEMEIGNFSDVRSTHLSKENNEVLGQIILDRFIEGKNILMDLYNQGDFKFSDLIYERYSKLGQIWSQKTGMNHSL
jgi:hypothetical protein